MYWNINGGNHWQDKALRVFCPSPHLCHLPTVQSKSFNHLSIRIFAIAHLTPPTFFSTSEYFFWCWGFLQVLTQTSLFSSRSWSAYYPVFRAQSALGLSDGVSSIRNRRITFALHLYYATSVLCYITPITFTLHLYYATSLLCYITHTFALHMYYASSRHMASICKRQIGPHCKLLSPHFLSSSEISDYLWNIRTR